MFLTASENQTIRTVGGPILPKMIANGFNGLHNTVPIGAKTAPQKILNYPQDNIRSTERSAPLKLGSRFRLRVIVFVQLLVTGVRFWAASLGILAVFCVFEYFSPGCILMLLFLMCSVCTAWMVIFMELPWLEGGDSRSCLWTRYMIDCDEHCITIIYVLLNYHSEELHFCSVVSASRYST